VTEIKMSELSASHIGKVVEFDGTLIDIELGVPQPSDAYISGTECRVVGTLVGFGRETNGFVRVVLDRMPCAVASHNSDQDIVVHD
jgi:DNA replicative helicase MCM subunit Mcm2 (Cdc46/Mcm family)